MPGLGPRTALAVAAWIADPRRFKSRSGLSSYAGLGLRQDYSNWKPTNRARASKRPQVRTFSGADRPGGNRELKRALFIAAKAAINGSSSLRSRYDARIAAGWEGRKAIRDIARTILFAACACLSTDRRSGSRGRSTTTAR